MSETFHFTREDSTISKPKPKPVENPLLKIDYEPSDIAFLIQQWNYYSGGRYFDYMMSLALQLGGYDIIRYTNMNFSKMENDFRHYDEVPLKLADLNVIDVPHTNTIVTANHSALHAIELCSRYHKNLVLFVYDPPQWIMTNNHLRNYGYEYPEIFTSFEIKLKLEAHYHNIPNIKIICMTPQAIPYFREWYNIPNAEFHYIEPCVNTQIIDFVNSSINKKSNIIVCASRNDIRKNFGDSVGMLRQLYNDYELHFITNTHQDIDRFAVMYSIPRHRIVIHESISDLSKFQIIRKAKALISTSKFEGYGMWAIEGLSCKTPVVCYDLQSHNHLSHEHLYKCSDFYQMEETLHQVLAKDNEVEFDYSNWSIESAAEKLKSIIGPIPKHTLDSHITFQIEPVKTFKTIDYNTRPVVVHFNSIYRDDLYDHLHMNRWTWTKILKAVKELKVPPLNEDIEIITFSNNKKKLILELCADHLGIPLTVVGRNWSWTLGFRILFEKLNEAAAAIKASSKKYFLVLDGSDLVITGDLNRLLNYDSLESKVLFAAEEACHPESTIIQKRQNAKAPEDSPFKYLNSGSFFGTRENMLRMYERALAFEPYETTNEKIKDCDQGRFNLVYLETDLIELDHYAKYFYCNDQFTIAEARLTFEM